MNRKTFFDSANKVLKIVNDISDVAVHLKKPSLIGMSLVAAKAIGSYQDITKKASKDYFNDWDYYSFDPLEDVLFNILVKNGMLVSLSDGCKKEGKAVSANIYGFEIGWMLYEGWKSDPRVPKGTDKVKLNLVLAGLVWEKVCTNIKLTINPLTKSFVLSEDYLTQSFPSNTANVIFERLSRFIEKGYNRAALLSGESGTGKSHIMREVAKKFGGLTLRLRASDLRNASTLTKILRLLQPSALLIDDLDRSDANLVDDFEDIKVSTTLFLASVNNVKKLDSATLRYERFDEYFVIDKLDDVVLERLLEDIPSEIAAKLRKLPVTCIGEYRKIQDVYGNDFDPNLEVAEIEKRAELVRSLANGGKKKKIQEDDEGGQKSDEPYHPPVKTY